MDFELPYGRVCLGKLSSLCVFVSENPLEDLLVRVWEFNIIGTRLVILRSEFSFYYGFLLDYLKSPTYNVIYDLDVLINSF